MITDKRELPSVLVAGMSWPPETFLRRLITGLARYGVGITVGLPRDPKPELGDVQWLRVPSWNDSVFRRLMDTSVGCLRTVTLHPQGYRRVARSAGNALGLLEKLRVRHQLLPFVGRRWDVLYFPWITSAVSHLPIYNQARSVVVSCRGTQINVAPCYPPRQGIVRSFKTCFERAAVVHCVSSAMVESACDIGLDRSKAVVIRPAVDTDQFVPRTDEINGDRPLMVSCVGNLSWVKGHEWALMALRECVDRGLDVRMNIVGDGSDRSRLVYTIQDLGLGERVKLHGKLPVSQVASIVRNSDVYLQSSVSEGISNAVLEAMACAVPVVTTECGGMREAVRDGVDGIVTRICNSRDIADAILRLGRDMGYRRQLGLSARARVVQEFNLKGHIEQWVQLLLRTVVH